jgi:hypothetical protein
MMNNKGFFCKYYKEVKDKCEIYLLDSVFFNGLISNNNIIFIQVY